MSQSMLLLYPPLAYPYMPYMASNLLKGYIEDSSSHTVDCVNLNGAYYQAVWSGKIFEETAADISAMGKKALLQRELITEWGPHSLEKLRSQRTYDDESVDHLSTYHRILRLAKLLCDQVDRYRGIPESVFPGRKKSWPDISEIFSASVAGKFSLDSIRKTNLQNYSVLGFSAAYVEQLPYCLLIAELAKKLNPDIKTAIGGGAFTHILDSVLEDTSFWRHIDAGIPYEGEYSLLQLLDAYENEEPVANLPNIVSFSSNAVTYRKALKERPKIEAIPDFSDLSHDFPTPEPIIPLLTSKGCYWGKCAFCTHHEGYGEGYFSFSEEHVNHIMERLIAAGHSSFYLVDEALPPKVVWRMAELIKKIGGKYPDREIKWMAESRAEKNFCGDEYVLALKESGCKLLFNGIESGVQRVIDLMKKGIDLKTAEILLRKCRAAGIRTGWMFFIGFPGETTQEARETFEFIRSNSDFLDYATVGTFSLEKGAPIMNAPAKWGIIPLVNADDKYQLIIPFTDQTKIGKTELKDKSSTRQLLSQLLVENQDLKNLFQRLPERSVGLFLSSDDVERDDRPLISWHSKSQRLSAIFEYKTGSIALLKPSSIFISQ